MAISEQIVGETVISSDDLKSTYEDVIKVALLSARPSLEIVRADEVAIPGSITTDILSHIMYDEYVIVDITHPNPNVYYELGVRHCCKPGTILIRNSAATTRAPFDISNQRYIEYEATPRGIKELSKTFREYFTWFDKNPTKPDNQVLQYAQLIRHNFPQYNIEKEDNPVDSMVNLFTMLMTNPSFMQAASDDSLTPEEKNAAILGSLSDRPELIKIVIQLMMRGELDSFDKLLGK
ncbi:hypothetical protein J7E24_13240 [Hymenobacter sp. ISL-91]|nr:hypothetical protein [Hymenobacter sp. ISL-91]